MTDFTGTLPAKETTSRAALISAVIKLTPLALVTIGIIPLQWLALKTGAHAVSRRLPMVFHRLACWTLGLKVTARGAPAPERPLLIAANHVSWMDIVVLGSLMPLSFVAKAEVGRWPMIGTFARLQRTIFVDRTRRQSTGQTMREIGDRLSNGDAMVLFPEGTSSDGMQVLPFRSALIGAVRAVMEAGEHPPQSHVQPVGIGYVAVHGLPVSRAERPSLGWYGDMELGSHLLGVLHAGPIDVTVAFGAPLSGEAVDDRKQLTRTLEGAVRLMVGAMVTGRDPLPPLPAPPSGDTAA